MHVFLYLAVDAFDYFFAENGLVAYKLGKALPSASFIQYIGEDRYKVLVKFILHYIADLDIPIKRYAFSIILSVCTSHPSSFFPL
jgi:phosphomannomutase